MAAFATTSTGREVLTVIEGAPNATPARTSALRGFYELSQSERRRVIESTHGVEGLHALDHGGLTASSADDFVENALGIYALPYGVALNLRVNGKDYLAPMVVEEPSVIAAASFASKLVRAGGGFDAEADEPLMIAQVQLVDVSDASAATQALEAARAEILQLADLAAPSLVRRGGGAREVEVRVLGEPADAMLVVHIVVDCRDAMGANLVNTIAEAVAGRLAEIAGARVGLRILSNLCDRRCVRVRCRVPAGVLATATHDGQHVIDGIVAASRFAELDPYRAATHNKGIMNGLDAVVMATGNDWRAVEAGAHAYAARTGRYAPLARWRREGDVLVGELEVPLALATVGRTVDAHEAVRLSLRLMGIESAPELACVAAAAGLASNLAALRALATEGIQRGHMALHARAVAAARAGRAEVVDVDIVRAACDGRAIGDDRLKDLHNAGWLYELAPVERNRWLERVVWMRRVDRMAEAESLHPSSRTFSRFFAGWERLRETGIAPSGGDEVSGLLCALRDKWFDRGEARDPFAVNGFDRYVKASRRYHGANLRIETVAEHQVMLAELSGALLLSMPHAPVEYVEEILALGAVDQLFNDVRDLVEDSAAGVCRFPTELLERFGLRVEDLIIGQFDASGVAPLLDFVVSDLAARMRRSYTALSSDRTIHPTWQRLVSEFERRHELVEQTLRTTGFDVKRFTALHWAKAREAAESRATTGCMRKQKG